MFVAQQARFVVQVPGSAPGTPSRGAPNYQTGNSRTLFTTVTGLEARIEMVEREIGGSPVNYKYPRKVRWGDVTLAGGVTNDMGLWRWFVDGASAAAGVRMASFDFRRTVSIIQFDHTRRAIFGWRLIGAVPRVYRPGKWEGASDEFLIESIRLAVHAVQPFKFAGFGTEVPRDASVLTSALPEAT